VKQDTHAKYKIKAPNRCREVWVKATEERTYGQEKGARGGGDSSSVGGGGGGGGSGRAGFRLKALDLKLSLSGGGSVSAESALEGGALRNNGLPIIEKEM
jgi:hypothetical protein